MQNYSGSPYYDRYSGDNTDHMNNGYTRVLAKPGFAEQASEFNEIQSIQRDYLGRLGSAFFTDGAVVSGCALSTESVVVSGQSKIQLTIGAGRIFIDGLVRDVPQTACYLDGEGDEYLVAKLTTTVITADTDESLRDPAIGSYNFNKLGADREKQVVTLQVTKTNDLDNSGNYFYAVVYHFVDGKLPNSAVVNSENNNFSFMTDVLAERTYDENGNYKVFGLDLQPASEGLENDTKVRIYISAGRAYIKGYQVIKDSMFDIVLDRSTSTRTRSMEPIRFVNYSKKYKLTYGPVSSVGNITVIRSVTETVNRRSIAGGKDTLSYTPVYEVDYVTSSDGSYTYERGVSYNVVGDDIDWSLTGDGAVEPTPGTTYKVTYKYNYTLTSSRYKIINDLDDSYLVLKSSAQVYANSIFHITYDYTLARRDLILLDYNGNVSCIQGVPNSYKDLITPYNGSDDYISLGYVNLFPKDNITTSNNDIRKAEVVDFADCRLTQNTFITMLKRINALEDSIAQLDLERSAEEGEVLSSLSGYFTDNFDNLDKSDLGYTGEASYTDINNVSKTATLDYTASINYVDRELTTQTVVGSKDLGKSSISSGERQYFGDILSAPFTLEKVLEQTFITGDMKVNPYASYGPLNKVELNPSKDSWTDTDRIVVPNTIENSVYEASSRVISVRSSWSRASTVETTTTLTGTTVSRSVTQSVTRTAIEFMRQREITVTGSGFGPSADNIICRFNNQKVDLTVLNNTATQLTQGRVRANTNGYFEAKFTIPSKVPCGKASVQLVTDNGSGSSGTAIYEAVGTLLTTTVYDTTTITSHYNVLTTRTNYYNSDPLAQSFMLSDTYDMNLAKIDLYFKEKDDIKPAVLQVRNMVNGYPGETVYAEVNLYPSNGVAPNNGEGCVIVNTSTNGTAVTEVPLDQPVYCKAGVYYCFVVLSDKNTYSMFYAEMGKNRIDGNNREQLVVNPYSTGVMFSSSNASTWTAHQGADLRFALYRTRYSNSGNGEIVFNDIPISAAQILAPDMSQISDFNSGATGVMLDAAYQVGGDATDIVNTNSLVWYYRYKLEGGENFSDWLPIDTLVYRDFSGIAKTVSLKAVIHADYNTSPFIDMSRVSLRMLLDNTSAVYVSKSLDEYVFEEAYQGLKISYQAHVPTRGSIDVFYMESDYSGNTGTYDPWIYLKEDSNTVTVNGAVKPNVSCTITPVDEEYEQYTWEINNLPSHISSVSSPGSRFFKIAIKLNVEPEYRYNRPRVKKLSVIFRNLSYS